MSEETPILNKLGERRVAPPTPSLLDSLPTKEGQQTMRHGDGENLLAHRQQPGTVAAPLHGGGELPNLTVGAFFAQHRALIDERRAPLARLGMMERQVDALRMPDLEDLPKAPAVHVDTLPPANQAGVIEPRKAPTGRGSPEAPEE